MDAAFARVQEIKAHIDESIDAHEIETLRAEREALWNSFRTVDAETPMSTLTGLQFVRMELSLPQPNVEGVLHVVKRLIGDARKMPVATTLGRLPRPVISKKKMKSSSATPHAHPRPKGAPKKGMTWDYDNGGWVPKDALLIAPVD